MGVGGVGVGGESKEEKVDEGKVGRSVLFLLLHSLHFIPPALVIAREKDYNVVLGSVVGAFNNKNAVGGLMKLGVSGKDDRQQLVDRCRIRLMICINECVSAAS